MRWLRVCGLAGLLACGDDVTVAERPVFGAGSLRVAERAARTSGAPAADATGELPSPAAIQSMWADQKLIRSGRLTMEVDDVTAALHKADSIARQRDAFVADVQVSRYALGRTAEFVVRVASARFDEIIADLRTLGDVRSEAITAEDVTKEYADLGMRLGVKEEAVARLRSLLANRTGSLADVLAVERELSRAVTELEQLKGEQRYYDQRIAVSNVTVSVFERGAGDRSGFRGRVRIAIDDASDVLGQSVAALVYATVFLAPWLLLATGGWIVATRVRARRHR